MKIERRNSRKKIWYNTVLRGTGGNVCISETKKEALVPATGDERLGKKSP